MQLLSRRALIPLFAIVLAALALGGYVALRSHAPYSLARIDKADTPAEQEHGLGGRADIPTDYGMLFVFAKPGDYAFWMKDMLASIDIIWLSDTGAIVGIDSSVAPDTYPHLFHPPSPVRYVLETRAGNAKAHEWKIGTQLSLPIP